MMQPNVRKIRITVGDQVLIGLLEEECAPATCAAFAKLLPLRAPLIQARCRGEAGWVPLGDLDIGVGPENVMQRPRPGQILFYPAGDSETEMLIPYGITSFAAKCGPLLDNHFLTINGAEKQLKEIGRRVLWEGRQDIRFDLL